MKARCPHCQTTLDLEEIFREGDLHAVIRLLPAFAPHGRLVWEYVELFGITPVSRRAAKIRRLLDEMAVLWERETFSFQRHEHAITRTGIAEALRTCTNRGDLKLTDHNYLKRVMVSISERQAKERSIAAERTLHKKEERLMAGDVIENPDYEVPDHIREKIRELGRGKFKS